MSLQSLVPIGITAFFFLVVYLTISSTLSIADDIKRMADEDTIRLSPAGELLANEAMEYLENQATIDQCLIEAEYDGLPSNN
ncbi:MAG: hypothetical protein PHU86_03630 [Patescibacteria group bacterium]|jgi:hypothetical protein|nr:hypothetical protein [Patescibacteria group bacterium]